MAIETHNLKLDGVGGFVFNVQDAGKKITVSGWNKHWNWKDGDLFILQQESGENTQYQLDRIERPGDPPDQYFMYMTFKPRA